MITKIKQWLTYATNDKALHFLWAFFITCISVAIFGWLGLIIPIVASLGKEAYDQYFGTGWDWYDLIADGVGITLGISIILLL